MVKLQIITFPYDPWEMRRRKKWNQKSKLSFLFRCSLEISFFYENKIENEVFLEKSSWRHLRWSRLSNREKLVLWLWPIRRRDVRILPQISQHTRAETETLLDCKTILSSDKSIMAENEPGKFIALASKLEPQKVQYGTHRDGLESWLESTLFEKWTKNKDLTKEKTFVLGSEVKKLKCRTE